MKPVAIICPVRGRPELTSQTIETLYENTKYPFELIVCDDASDEEVKSHLERLHEEYGFALLENKENLGITPTKNRCIRAISFDYDYFYVTDNDYWFAEGWLTLLIEMLEKHKDVRIMGGTTYPLHKVKEVRDDIIITEVQTGGTMLMTKETLKMVLEEYPDWTQDWHVSKLIQDKGFEVAHLKNENYVVHCGITLVGGRLNEKQTIRGGNKHIGAEKKLREICERNGCLYG